MRREVCEQKETECAPPHLSELDEAVFGKRSQGGVAKITGEAKSWQYRVAIPCILHENQSLVQENWHGIADKMI